MGVELWSLLMRCKRIRVLAPREADGSIRPRMQKRKIDEEIDDIIRNRIDRNNNNNNNNNSKKK